MYVCPNRELWPDRCRKKHPVCGIICSIHLVIRKIKPGKANQFFALLPILPLPILPVAHFTVAHITVAHFTVAHITVADITVNRQIDLKKIEPEDYNQINGLT
jgi:hypothetical protein